MDASEKSLHLLVAVCLLAVVGLFGARSGVRASEMRIAGSTCSAPPRIDCPESNCVEAEKTAQGDAVEPKTGRPFFLDYPCDLHPGEDVHFVLSLHGAGSVGNWQRHYFPLVDLKEKHRLVIATPTALETEPIRRWSAEADDAYLHNIVDLVFEQFGREHIATFWIAGHSQGGLTGRRIVCSDYFADKVDGFVSLSGGRVGSPPRAGRPAPAPLGCDFSFIYAAGALEAQAQSATDQSTWAERYRCGARERLPDVVDERAGYVTATDQTRGPAWGRFARPGTAQVYSFPNCEGGRVVADVIRLDKGHTEGYEPKILETIVKMMLSAPGGNAHDD